MRAVFLAAILPKTGPEVICLYPEDILTKEEIEELSMICMPMGSIEGDFSSVVFNGFQVAGYLTSTPPIDKNLDPRDTIVSIGFLLDIYTNPIPYRNLLIDFVIKCSNDESFTLNNLRKIIPDLLELKNSNSVIISINQELSCELQLDN
jgi:hypothetical protein